jgi:general stress protein 26
MTPEQKQKIDSVLNANDFGVIATNSGVGSPESAVISISKTPGGAVVFCSSDTLRKNHNIEKDPRISFVTGWDVAIRQTVQIEGIARLLEGADRGAVENAHCVIHKGFEKHKDNPHQQYFIIEPKWIRYSDLSANPESWEIMF